MSSKQKESKESEFKRKYDFFFKKLKINALWFRNCSIGATQGRSFNFDVF